MNYVDPRMKPTDREKQELMKQILEAAASASSSDRAMALIAR